VPGPLNVRRHPKAAPVHAPWLDPRLDEGIRLFNEGHFWHAHEAWEPLWMGLEGDDKLFLQGLIMCAAMLHQYERRIAAGVASHWENAHARLAPRAPSCWGIAVSALLEEARPFAAAAAAGDFSLRAHAVRIQRSPASSRT
jgi:hypothetical protein